MNGMIAASFTIAYLGVTFYHCRNYRLQIKDLTMCAVACALTIILSFFYVPLPTGATVSVGTCIPIIVLAIVFDDRLAMIAGWVTGILCIFLVPTWQPVHWAQFFMEHMVCFSCLGYAGIFGSESKMKLFFGTAIAFVLKLTGHVMSGVVFYSTNAWNGWGAWGYSISYNASSWLPEIILSAIILYVLPWKSIKLALVKMR